MQKILKRGFVVFEGAVPAGKEDNKNTYQSKRWKIWRATITMTTCYYCASMHGHILDKDDPCLAECPVHDNCRCYVEAVTAIVAGTATEAGSGGVDLFVFRHGRLPGHYLDRKTAQRSGWDPLKGNLAEVLPGRMIGGDLYKNRDGRLPDAPGRVWYEADFDYKVGSRNNCRLLFSNDGLVFVTYDHYLTFYEIGMEVVE